MQHSCLRLSAIAVVAAAGLAVAACGGSSSSNPSSGTAATSGASSSTPATTTYVSAKATVIGKSTAVVVNPVLSAALKHAGITTTAVTPATAKRMLRFPVSGGQITVKTLAGHVDHAGGLTFRHRGSSVTLTNLVINTQTKQLTAAVGGHSMPVFDLNHVRSKPASGRHGTVVARDVKLTVSSQAATVLNSDLGVSTFRTGMNFGIATLTVAYAHGHR
ncbi:MAG: hypothetical protein J2P17_23315 [Mycobacterium sp.]|nr:hypothetical protein [Mycobacterium sp.]